MHKKVSKRRWKARARLGKPIPLEVIVDHGLERCFHFRPVDFHTEMFAVVPSKSEGRDHG